MKLEIPTGRYVVNVGLFVFAIFLSFNSWSASTKRSPTPNFLPAGICSFKTKSFAIPKTDLRVSHFEIFNSGRGTGCLKGQTNSFWNKCDLRPGETEAGKDPSIDVIIKLRDSKTYRDLDQVIVPMTEIVDLGWVTDRKGNAKSIIEVTKRENVELGGYTLHLLAKRTIKNLAEDKMVTELYFYLPGDKEKKVRSKLLYQARCESEITNKSY